VAAAARKRGTENQYTRRGAEGAERGNLNLFYELSASPLKSEIRNPKPEQLPSFVANKGDLNAGRRVR
jgi:hypothetical protein